MLTILETLLQWLITNWELSLISTIIFLFTIFSIRYFRNKEEHGQKSWLLLLIGVMFGVISIVPSVILSLLLLIVIPESYAAVVVAPIAEEIGKALMVGLIARFGLIKDKMDGFVYGAMVGTGFAAVENYLYAFVSFTESGLFAGLFLASFRSALIVIGHPLYTGLTGIGIGAYKSGKITSKYRTIWQGMLLHAIWNSTSVYGGDLWLPIFLVVIALSLLIMKIQVNRAQS